MKAQSLTFFLLGLLTGGARCLQSVVFSPEVLLLVHGPPPGPPEVRVLAGPQEGVLVCLVSALRAGPVLISWRVYPTGPGTPVTPPGPLLVWTRADPPGSYRASRVWTRTGRGTSAWYCCGATQGPPTPRDPGTEGPPSHRDPASVAPPAGPGLEDGDPDLEACCHGAR
ncbi:uncharacterized protein LOC132469333 isoform X2 [Gadus macrocephalus]|uniref:uncharacterized protein LOC132469333 isoform X2 n=1 Tax=Gadus macrocephalus TaxID=80720 RepID=UPI0028CBBBF2|nr:uncharacterized protein LOC132469333 isoform X2 [Gadus macrocephalus]